MMDVRSLTGAITVRYADGTENFTNLRQAEITHPDAGEVIFVDDTGLVFARRWCWRQSDQSAAREDTTNLLVTIEGQHEGCQKDVEAAIRDLNELIIQHTNGKVINAIL